MNDEYTPFDEGYDAYGEIDALFKNPYDTGTQAFYDFIEGYEARMSEEYYDDSMDGDFDSAMASAGFGMDEDYA